MIHLILLMAAVTALPRLVPIWLLSGRRLPRFAQAWFQVLPAAVIAAILGPQLFMAEGSLDASPSSNPFPLAALPTLAVALRTRNILITVVTGIASLAIIRLIAA